MGEFTTYCVICAGLFRNKFKVMDDNDKERTVFLGKWNTYSMVIDSFERHVIIDAKDPVMKYEYGEVEQDGKTYKVSKFHWHRDDKKDYGIICHVDCYNFLKNRLKYKLMFAHVCRLLSDNYTLLKNYGKIGDLLDRDLYQEDSFDTVPKYIFESPLKNKENANRIMKIWEPLVKKFKKIKIRPSPPEHAGDFEEGEIVSGYDGFLWIHRSGKWYRSAKEFLPIDDWIDKSEDYALTIADILKLKKGDKLELLNFHRNTFDNIDDNEPNKVYKAKDLFKAIKCRYVHDHDLSGKISYSWQDKAEDFTFELSLAKGLGWYPMKEGGVIDIKGIKEFVRQGIANDVYDKKDKKIINKGIKGKKTWRDLPKSTLVGMRGHMIRVSDLDKLPDVLYKI